ncbi:MAG: glycosyltransferase family 39 protein [Planctomycetales bacterium]|nr:glycosyltransferase family 39 protein [Planctomycetales bacterium]
MQRWQVQLTIVLGVSLLAFFTNLGTPRLWDRDEPRNAGAASEMAARGDWVVPTFNDELRAQKPILTYWLILSAYAWLGETEFAARFWSAALSVGTVAWTWMIARRLLGPSRALWAPLALATFLMFNVAAHAATPDAPLVFCFTSTIGLWVVATFAPNHEDRMRTWSDPGLRHQGEWFPRHLGWSAGIYACLGLGVLAKGPVGFVLPIATIGMFNLLARLNHSAETPTPSKGVDTAATGRLLNLLATCLRPWHPVHFARTFWSMRPLSGIAIMLLIAAPWYLLVGLRTEGDFLEAFFLREHFGRATVAMENHRGGVWFYPLALLVGTFPWSILALPMMVAMDRQLSARRADRPLVLVLGLAWVALVVIAFTMARTKLPSYITPCHGGAALLYGWYVGQLAMAQENLARSWRRVIVGVLGSVGLLLVAGVILAAQELAPSLGVLALIGAIPLLGAIALALLPRENAARWLPKTLATIAVLWTVALFGFATTVVDQEQRADDLLLSLRDHPDARVASFGKLESSWVFYAGHPILELDPAPTNSVVIRDEQLERPHSWSPKPNPTLETFLALPGDHFVVVPESLKDQLLERAAGRLEPVATVPEFLNDDRLVLLGPPAIDRTAWESLPSMR